MEATIKLRDEDFTLEFFNKLKEFVKGKEVVISVKENDATQINNLLNGDDTEYLKSSTENDKQLLAAINRIENKENLVTIAMEDLQ